MLRIELAGDLEAVVEVAVDLDQLRAVHHGLGELARGDLALRDQHRAGDPGRGRVGRGGGGGVAGRGAHHRGRAVADGPRHRRDHAAILEGAGRVHTLDLHVHLGADALGECRGGDQGGAALPEGQQGVTVLEGQVLAVLGEDAAPLMGHGVNLLRCGGRSRC